MTGSIVVAGVLGFLATLAWVGFGVFVVVVLRPLLSLAGAVVPGAADTKDDPPDRDTDLAYAATQLDHAADRNGRPDVPGGRCSHAIERARRMQEVLVGGSGWRSVYQSLDDNGGAMAHAGEAASVSGGARAAVAAPHG